MASSLLKLFLVPVVLVAQMLCVCAHAEAKPVEPKHACCQSDETPAHAPHCPHCGDDAPQKPLADRPAADAHVAVPPPILVAFDFIPAPAPAAVQPAADPVAAPADLALVTCVRLN